MDPLAHTLLGAALAQTRIGRATPLAMPVLVLAANVPDLDVAAYFWGSDAALAFRRGLTHGPLGLALLPALCAIVVWWAGRRWSRVPLAPAVPAQLDAGDWAHRRVPHPGPAHRAPAHREPRPRLAPGGRRRSPAAFAGAAAAPALAPLLALAYLGALTHPVLDWLNTYGVRFLYPFDPRWFYGDILFIVDPWVWLGLGAAVFLAHRGSRRTLAQWGALGAVAAAFVLTAADSAAAKALWIAALAAAVAVRGARRPRTERGRRLVATGAVVAFAIYVAAAGGAAAAARSAARASIDGRVEGFMVGPVPITPLRREVVWSTPREIRRGEFDWLGKPRFRAYEWSRPRPLSTRVVEAALADPSIQGFLAWARFLFVEVDEHPDHWEVHLLDARYTIERGAPFGSAMVRVPR